MASEQLNHSTSKLHLTDIIFKLTLIHAPLILSDSMEAVWITFIFEWPLSPSLVLDQHEMISRKRLRRSQNTRRYQKNSKIFWKPKHKPHKPKYCWEHTHTHTHTNLSKKPSLHSQELCFRSMCLITVHPVQGWDPR